MLKNQKGFTLVEVIVVAVIVAVLAAVAIPFYNAYIKDSAANVAKNTASTAAGWLLAARSNTQEGIGGLGNLSGGGSWALTSMDTTAGAKDIIFVCPLSAVITLVSTDSLTCTVTKGNVVKTAGSHY